MAEETFLGAISAEVALVPSDETTAVIEGGQLPYDLAGAIEKAEELAKAWVIELPAIGALLDELAEHEDVTVYCVPEISDTLFATNREVVPERCQIVVKNGKVGARAVAAAPEAGETVTARKITKVFKTDEERYVLGVVLAPETADSQGDIYSHHEVRKAAHTYMELARDLGKQHKEIMTTEQLRILESYVAPVDFSIGEEKVTSGTWLMGIRVVDDDLWDGIKKGDFTGFSIGGAAYRKPEVS